MKTGKAELNESKIYYEVYGEEQPLVLISGGSLDNRMWDDQIKEFAAHYQVIRYDMRGIGKSSIPDKSFSHSDDLYHLLKFLNVEKASILGLSFGAAIAVDFALKHPAMVKALILAAPGLSSSREENLQGALFLSSVAKEKGVSQAIQMILNDSSFSINNSAHQKIREILFDNAHIFESDFPLIRFWQPPEFSVVERLSTISVPTFIIVGSNDYAPIYEIADKLEESIIKSLRVVISDAGHMVNLDNPVGFNNAALSFLQNQ